VNTPALRIPHILRGRGCHILAWFLPPTTPHEQRWVVFLPYQAMRYNNIFPPGLFNKAYRFLVFMRSGMPTHYRLYSPRARTDTARTGRVTWFLRTRSWLPLLLLFHTPTPLPPPLLRVFLPVLDATAVPAHQQYIHFCRTPGFSLPALDIYVATTT